MRKNGFLVFGIVFLTFVFLGCDNGTTSQQTGDPGQTTDPGPTWSFQFLTIYEGYEVTEVLITGFTHNSTGFPTDLVIPSTYDGLPITSIGNSAFSSRGLTSVTIPNGITSIGTSAFNNNYLTTINIPDSVTFIGESAFLNNSITSVVLRYETAFDVHTTFDRDVTITRRP